MLGRCMGALMADEVFQDVSYKSQTKQHLLDACDEFMHQVMHFQIKCTQSASLIGYNPATRFMGSNNTTRSTAEVNPT
jgi:hypothetical protein